MKENNEAKISSPPAPKCNYEGCLEIEDLVGCRISDEEIISYCEVHADELGFCQWCGGHWTPVEPFSLPGLVGNIPGCCADCSSAIIDDVDASNLGESDPEGDWLTECEAEMTGCFLDLPHMHNRVSAASEEEDDLEF